MGAIRLAYTVIFLAVVIGGCAPQVRDTAPELQPVAGQVPENLRYKHYEQAAASGKAVYRVDSARSLLAITVRRGGSLARFGHDHVVASHEVQGFIAPEDGRADLHIPLEKLSVDEAALRADAGLDTQPSESDIAATRVNMLDKVLETQQFPFAFIHVSGLESLPVGVRVNVSLTLHGVTRLFNVPVELEAGRDEMSVAGMLELRQSDFGIVPFSILGGAVQVLDRMDLSFRIRARRV